MIIIKKEYHFYAAHRNELIKDKCRNLHGHTYYVTAHIAFPGEIDESGVTMLFSDIDKVIDPIINKLDHCTLIHRNDALLPYLMQYVKDTGDNLKIITFNHVTSAENIAKFICEAININGLDCRQIDFKETTSSTVIYQQPLK